MVNTAANGVANGESGHVRIVHKGLWEIEPSPQNENLYRPVSPGDPEVLALAQSIKEHGVKEPLIVSLDNYIISGHRRYVASGIAGLETVPCRVEEIRSTDSKFLLLLRECNRQRVKSIDEVLREEVVSANPKEAHRRLVEHRKERAEVSAETIELEGEKRRAEISENKQPFLDAIVKVIRERRSFWPLTDRQIHYALLNDPPLRHAKKPDSAYRNDLKSYKDACDLITRARLKGLIPYQAVDDPTRPISTWQVHRAAGAFIREQMDDFLKGYYRDLQQSQLIQVEIVAEKNTVNNIIRPVAADYCIPMTTGRGYCSIPPRKKMVDRYLDSGKEKLVILVLSDFDPEGEDIAHSFTRSIRDDFGIFDVEAVKVALTSDQVAAWDLPPQMKAKQSSSRYEKFVDRYGDDVFELEAVPPEQLQDALRETIDSVIDVDAFNAEIDREAEDAAHLDKIRGQMLHLIAKVQGGEQPSEG